MTAAKKIIARYIADPEVARSLYAELHESGCIAPFFKVDKIGDFLRRDVAPLIKDAYESGELE